MSTTSNDVSYTVKKDLRGEKDDLIRLCIKIRWKKGENVHSTEKQKRSEIIFPRVWYLTHSKNYQLGGK